MVGRGALSQLGVETAGGAAEAAGEARYRALRGLLERALDLDDEARQRLVAEAAREDTELAMELAELIRADAASSVLDGGIHGLVAELGAAPQDEPLAAGTPTADDRSGAASGRGESRRPALVRPPPGRRLLFAAMVLLAAGAAAVGVARWRSTDAERAWQQRLAEAERLGRMAAAARREGHWTVSRSHAARQLALAESLIGDRPQEERAMVGLAEAALAVHAVTVDADGRGRPDLLARALAVRRRLAVARPDLPARRAAVAAVLRELGSTAGRSGDHAAAQAHLEEAVSIEDGLFAAGGDDPALRGRLVESLLLLGAQRSAARRPAAALEPLARAARLLEEVTPMPAAPDLVRLRVLVAAETSLAELALDRVAAALASQQRAVESLRLLLARPAAPARLSLEAMVAYRDLGDLHRRLAAGAEGGRAEGQRHLLAARDAYRDAAAVAVERIAGPDAREEHRAVYASLADLLAATERELAGGRR